MVKMSDTIICQRFVQNAWKKDLCSNCFKSKEDHIVMPAKKIAYRWTSHVNNFPQHGILKRRAKSGKTKRQTVSFRTNDNEIIGFGGEEYSSDDEMYAVCCNEQCAINTDNEEVDKEFRKLTQTNTDFNSIAANLKTDTPSDVSKTTYSNLKLGKPLMDADGRKQTLQVTVEPFTKSIIVSNNCSPNERSSSRLIHLNKISLDYSPNGCKEKTDNVYINCKDINSNNINKSNSNDSNNCNRENSKKTILNRECPVTVCDTNANTINNGVNVVNLNETVNKENIYVKCNLNGNEKADPIENGFQKEYEEENKFFAITNVLVNVSNNDSNESKIGENINDKKIITENIKNAKSKLEPLFKLNSADDTTDKQKLSIYQTTTIKEKRSCSLNSNNKDCNPINLPLIAYKNLEIELDEPGSREMVGEPDGKADSDDSSDPLSSAEYTENTTTDTKPTDNESLAYVNPQKSFLHGFSKEKPKPAMKPVTLLNGVSKSVMPKDVTETTPTNTPLTLSTPKMQISTSGCNGTGSTKRQAPQPPSPVTGHVRALSTPVPVSSCATTNTSKMKETTSTTKIDANANAVFLNVKRRLNLDTSSPYNRNSLNIISLTSNNIENVQERPTSNGYPCSGMFERENIRKVCSETDTPTINQAENKNVRNAVKCTRSLSCDSIVSSPASINLSDKNRKYSGATIKVKSTLRRFLRLNSKDDDKWETDVQIPIVPRKRIEIIHPLDLNKSSIEILPVTLTKKSSLNKDLDAAKKTDNDNNDVTRTSPSPNIKHATYLAGRPNKPPPPPRTQSLDQKLISEISKPARPPPPKSINLKIQPCPKFNSNPKSSSTNVYENLGEFRHGIPPAKPQRASSMRDRARQATAIRENDNTSVSLASETETVPECDQNHQQLDACGTPTASSMSYCGSETESDMCYRSVTSSSTESSQTEIQNILQDAELTRKNKSVVHNSLEDNYGAVVIANHEALSQLLEQVNQTTLIPNSLKVLQNTAHIRFDNFTVDENSKLTIADWHFYNAKYINQDVVISASIKHLGSIKSLPSWITLYPITKFTDIIPDKFVKNDSSTEEMNAYITVWNEEQIESIFTYCNKISTATTHNERGFLLTQLINALKHLQACGIEDVSLDELLICKRESDIESKLLLLPINIDYVKVVDENNSSRRMSLCKCVSTVLDMLTLKQQQLSDTIKRLLDDEKATSLTQTKAVTEYWLWGPCDVNLSNDRQTSLQRWLDLERATYLHKIVCKKSYECSLHERYHLMFLVRTNIKTLIEASYLL